jgi:hypothetical protein
LRVFYISRGKDEEFGDLLGKKTTFWDYRVIGRRGVRGDGKYSLLRDTFQPNLSEGVYIVQERTFRCRTSFNKWRSRVMQRKLRVLMKEFLEAA